MTTARIYIKIDDKWTNAAESDIYGYIPQIGSIIQESWYRSDDDALRNGHLGYRVIGSIYTRDMVRLLCEFADIEQFGTL